MHLEFINVFVVKYCKSIFIFYVAWLILYVDPINYVYKFDYVALLLITNYFNKPFLIQIAA